MALVTGADTRIDQETKGWKFAVGSGILGWVLDAFDFFVVVFLFDTLAEHFHVSKASVVYTLTLTLAMRPLGALFFGALADRFGRKFPLIICVLYFSLLTVLTGLAPNYLVFVVCRALYGIGMGGYWGIGASYAMEMSPRGVMAEWDAAKGRRMSSMCSMPTLSRMLPGPTPAASCSSGDICRCVVDAGWHASDFASPKFTSRLNSLSAL